MLARKCVSTHIKWNQCIFKNSHMSLHVSFCLQMSFLKLYKIPSIDFWILETAVKGVLLKFHCGFYTNAVIYSSVDGCVNFLTGFYHPPTPCPSCLLSQVAFLLPSFKNEKKLTFWVNVTWSIPEFNFSQEINLFVNWRNFYFCLFYNVRFWVFCGGHACSMRNFQARDWAHTTTVMTLDPFHLTTRELLEKLLDHYPLKRTSPQ